MSRPIIKIPLRTIDWILEVVALLMLTGTVIFIFNSYASLPDKIATHFNSKGEPDAFGSKSTLWLIMGINIFIYGLLSLAARIPHKFNYLIEITEENAARQYQVAIDMMRGLKVITMFVFCFLAIRKVMIGEGEAISLGNLFLPIALIAIFSVLIIGIIRMNSK
jgi:uncharacterized membrane protein